MIVLKKEEKKEGNMGKKEGSGRPPLEERWPALYGRFRV